MSSERSRQVDDLYFAALECGPEKRAELLARAEPELRREVMDRLRTVTQLKPGTRLGPYQIGEKLGEGGMGQVFRARDTRLGRDVAIKICAESFRERFEHEARAIAALNHPHICAIYDVGPDYIVMELVEGKTLAERVPGGALPLSDALPIARQIAAALEAAHEKGIVHRDLKPGNVKVKADGTVKVLDFGLAKTIHSQPEPGESTLTAMQTKSGAIVGTVAYMSPEQARGQEIDKRTDIWAFGVVLYEMLTGERPFKGATFSDILAAVLTQEPDWQHVPGPAQRLLRRCLEKDPRRRLRDMGDAGIELEELTHPASGDSREIAQVYDGRSRSVRWMWPSIAAIAVAVAVAAVLHFGGGRPEPAVDVTRTAILLPPAQVMDENVGQGSGPSRHRLALSPDGKFLAYAASAGGVPQLFLRALAEFDARPLPGTEEANFPIFSPDGRWVAFFANYRLQKVRISGGAPITICSVPVIGRGASWGPGDTIVFSAGNPAGLWRVSASGGTPVQITTPTGGIETYHSWPHMLRGGKAVVFSLGTWGPGGLALLSLETGKWKPLLKVQAKQAHYLPTGHLVYAVEGAVRAVSFDLATLRITSSPVPVVDPVFDESGSGGTEFAVSNNGALVYLPGGVNFMLVWVDRSGRVTPLTGDKKGYRFPALSPDGTQVSVTVDPPDQGDSDIWIHDVSSGTGRRLTNEGHNLYSVWNPEGSRVAWGGGLSEGVSWQSADGTGKRELLYSGRLAPRGFSTDGRWLLFARQDPVTSWDLAALPLKGDQKPVLVANSRAREGSGAISPDGRWLAFGSNESGRPEVYVQPFPGPGRKVRVSDEGGEWPVWSAKGELFYKNGFQIVAVPVQAGDAFHFGKPEILFEDWSLIGSGGSQRFDVTRDGKKFLMIKNVDRIQGTQLRVVLNWFEELKERVPTR